MPKSVAIVSCLLGIALLNASCGGGGSTDVDPGPAASLAILDGNSSSAVVGETRAVLVRVLDADRIPVPGQVVRFRVTSGGGQVTNSATISDAQGLARDTWRLGTRAGEINRLVVAIVDTLTGSEIAPATISVTPRAGPAALAIRVSGNQQVGPNQRVAIPLVLRVTDNFGNPVAGHRVTWRKVSGGGEIISPAATTGADGHASAAFQTGSIEEQVLVGATAEGLGTVTFTVTVVNITERLAILSGRPFDVAVTAAGVVLVSELYGNRLTRFDLATPTVHQSITVGSTPSGIAINPAGTLAYSADQGSGAISVVSLSTNVRIAQILLGQDPLDVEVMPNGSKVYASSNTATIFVIDPATNTVTKSFPVLSGPYSFAFSGDSVVYVAARNAGGIIEIDTRTDVVRRNIRVDGRPHDIALSADSRTLYIANETLGSVQFLDLASSTFTSVSVGTAFGLARSTDGSKVYVSVAQGEVKTIDTATRSIVSSIRTGGNPKRIAVHGSSVLIADEGGWVNIIR